LTDKIVKEWKTNLKPDEFLAKMMERLGGFVTVAERLQGKTLTGAWDMLLGVLECSCQVKLVLKHLKQK